MEYSKININNTIDKICDKVLVERFKINQNDFTRNRKVTVKDIILYELNKKGLSTKMEIINFNDINNIKNISSPGLFKQREKLNPDVFTYLMQESLKDFYYHFKDEVKTYKGYILLGIDGSDFEIPNNKKTREKYNGKNVPYHCARITVSTCYDLLNCYTIDTIIEKYRYSETEMAKRHFDTIKEQKLLDEYKTIRIMDRNYRNLGDMYNSINNNEKFLLRIASSVYKQETSAMSSNDEIISIKHSPARTKYYKESYPELYRYFKSGKTLDIRCVKVRLDTGEIEYLLTNLSSKEFNTKEISELYNLRWKIELNYRHLKNGLKIECITSSKEILIKQDILSQVFVSNLLQAFINENDKKIDQTKYKNKMKINQNMSIGIFKNTLIYILLENNICKRRKMMNKFSEVLMKYTIPIKPGRKNSRVVNPQNKYHINRRNTY